MNPSVVRGARRRGGASRARALRGVTLVELLVVFVIIAALLSFGVPSVTKMFRRMEGSSALSGISRVLTTARLAAIKGVSGATMTTPPAPVVVMIEKGGSDNQQIRIWSFVDNNQSYNFTAGERILDDVVFPSTFHFWKQSEGDSGKDAIDKAVYFDEYTPPAAVLPAEPTGAALTRRIVFLPNGGIVAPAATASKAPTKDDGRGLYFADRNGLNYFRVTIYSDAVGRPVAEKWVEGASAAETGYLAAGWSWK